MGHTNVAPLDADVVVAWRMIAEALGQSSRADHADALVNDIEGRMHMAREQQVAAGRADPPEPIRWAPTDVWSSCDGKLAVTLGRFLRPNGLVGDYITVWELQSDNSYKWIYDTGTPDDPQPAPLAQRAQLQPAPSGTQQQLAQDSPDLHLTYPTDRSAECGYAVRYRATTPMKPCPPGPSANHLSAILELQAPRLPGPRPELW